jgi:hypothetical protein
LWIAADRRTGRRAGEVQPDRPGRGARADEITANATAADVVLEQAQLEALTALRAGDDS